jgi:hypothetical protein
VSDAETVLGLVVTQGRARLEGQLRDSDALDVKALGILGADAAALGVLIATHDAISTVWWIPAAGLGVVALLLFVALWPRRLDSGPNWRVFYETYGGGAAVDVGRQMLGELLDAVDSNDESLSKPRLARSLSSRWRSPCSWFR